jgi:hypothetical protein
MFFNWAENGGLRPVPFFLLCTIGCSSGLGQKNKLAHMHCSPLADLKGASDSAHYSLLTARQSKESYKTSRCPVLAFESTSVAPKQCAFIRQLRIQRAASQRPFLWQAGVHYGAIKSACGTGVEVAGAFAD